MWIFKNYVTGLFNIIYEETKLDHFVFCGYQSDIMHSVMSCSLRYCFLVSKC